MDKPYKAPEVRNSNLAKKEGFIFFTDVATALESGRKVLLEARGWSMLPMIWDRRDNLFLAPLTEDSITVGRLLFVRLSSKRYILHRLEAIDGNRLTLRGDGNPYQREECDREEVLGELIAVERDGKMLELGSQLWESYETCWPKNSFVRRVLLFFYKRIFIFKSFKIPKD